MKRPILVLLMAGALGLVVLLPVFYGSKLIASFGLVHGEIGLVHGESSGYSRSSGSDQDKSKLNRLIEQVSKDIDAGVIFADQLSYFCIPLARYQVGSANNVESIRTSYKCVLASLVKYEIGDGETVDCIRFDFVPEHRSDRLSSPVQLAVNVAITLFSGESQQFSIKFVHAMMLPDTIIGDRP